MQNTLVIDPLDRTCTEVLTHDGQSEGRAKPGAEPVSLSVRQLASVPVFVLLGEPGMGKSETMRALADHVEGEFITANDFIVVSSRHQRDAQPVLIDALDEARAIGGTTVWMELRRGIAHAGLTRFGVACRVADWFASEKSELATVAPSKTVRVFALDALSTEQRRMVLVHEGIQEVDTFEQQAQRLGFADMLGPGRATPWARSRASALSHRVAVWPELRTAAAW